MNNNNCLLCNSKNTYEFIKEGVLSLRTPVYKCKGCGVVYLHDNKEKIDDGYWNKEEQKDMYLNAGVQEDFSKEFTERLKILTRIKKNGKLLDIGCGLGQFLKLAKDSGYEVHGLDVSKQAVKFVREKFGIDAEVSTIEQSRYPDNKFDVITLWDVFEHLQEPVDSVKAIRNKLKKDGLVVIKTPNENSLFKILSRTFYRISAKKISFLIKYVYYLPHYFSYTKKTISAFLKANGFRVVKIELENSIPSFAKEKIKMHYRKSLSKNFVLFFLPVVYFLAGLLHLQNKLVVYAVKE